MPTCSANISQNLQENTCNRVSVLLNKNIFIPFCQSNLTAELLKHLGQLFSLNYDKIDLPTKRKLKMTYCLSFCHQWSVKECLVLLVPYEVVRLASLQRCFLPCTKCRNSPSHVYYKIVSLKNAAKIEAMVSNVQKQPSGGVYRKGYSENMWQIYRRKSIPKSDFNFIEITLRHGWSPVNLLHIFKAPFSKNTSGGMLLNFAKTGLHCSCFPVNSQNFSEEISHIIHRVCFCHCLNHKFNEIVISDNQNNKIYFSLEKNNFYCKQLLYLSHTIIDLTDIFDYGITQSRNY